MRWRRFVAAGPIVLALVAGIASPPAAATPPPDVAVTVTPVARVVDEGLGAQFHVRTSCRLVGYEVIEAFLYVNQDQRSTEPAPLRIACDGRQRTSKVVSSLFEGDAPLRRGPASVSAYVLLESADGDTRATSPVFEVRLR